MNSLTMYGRIGSEITVNYAGDNNTAIGKFSLAVQKTRKNKEGKYDANFFNCVAFGKTAENIEKFMKKGSRIVIKGSLENNNYTDKNGTKHYTNQINVESFDFVDTKSDQGNISSTQATSTTEKKDEGFMNVPDTTEEELPF